MAPEVGRALSAAAELAESEPERAAGLLAWAKDVAPRSAAIREALGVASYRRGDFEGAARELGAYRRLSGRQDQNHLLADSFRGMGRTDRVRELVEAMGDDVEEERRVEGLLVHAGALADQGDALRAREVLERGTATGFVGTSHLRLWYLAAELSLVLHDGERARELFEAIVTVDPDFLDAGDQLAALGGDRAADDEDDEDAEDI